MDVVVHVIHFIETALKLYEERMTAIFSWLYTPYYILFEVTMVR